jgi:hypothetical protein
MWITSDEFDFFCVGNGGASTVSATTYETCTPINVGKYESVVFTIAMGGDSVTTSNFFLMECTASSALLASATTIIEGSKAYNYRVASTANSDLLGTRTAGVTTALTLCSTAGSMTVIEVKASDLTTGFPYVMPSISVAGAFRAASIVAVCKPRYPQNTMMSAFSAS